MSQADLTVVVMTNPENGQTLVARLQWIEGAWRVTAREDLYGMVHDLIAAARVTGSEVVRLDEEP